MKTKNDKNEYTYWYKNEFDKITSVTFLYIWFDC